MIQQSPLQGMSLQSKERWATRTRKKITACSKGLAEILAGLSEPFMKYAAIYLALATALPALNYGPLYAAGQGILIATPEFVIQGALVVAENAHKEGRKTWAVGLYALCALLGLIMITTFLDVFHLVQLGDQGVKWLAFARCIIAVAFGVILGKLDEDEGQLQPVQNTTSLHVQPVQPPIQPVHIEEIGKLTEEVNRLSALMLQMSQTVNVYVNSQEMGRNVQTHIQPVQEPIQQLPEVAGSIQHDEQEADTNEPQSTPEALATLYPEVTGISADVVKLVIDERMKGVAWSLVASNLGKNYTRVVKPIKEMYIATCTDIQAE